MEDWQAVASAINGRMAELPLTQQELAERSKVSVATLRELQYAKANRKRSTRTLAAISQALDWPDGYLQAVLTGATPPGARTGAGVPDGSSVVLARLDQLHAEVRRLADAVERIAVDVGHGNKDTSSRRAPKRRAEGS
ncbi:XRE family transcriptional regulator [Verrucosispora sp. NA02020]|uniref:XRE family transcriptional regulator n=1 Tax=Verrucosispora sp. NA02020 TaxID=2742132 RepID=UPI00159249F4|nr:XRE family transcriptional regulator [Verrucosispora sp. NA02020]QKW12399.1 XRE family transcriptional regulator [Verrucosispora sp. NA02020]